jgi:hypothetical protein
MTKLRIVCAAAALAATASGTALADATANVGFMSDYIFRGVYQSESTPFAGIDIEADTGFYIGIWGANVKDGLEYDLYLGYAGGGENFDWYTGFTNYFYTDNFDNSYEEFNAGFSFGFMSVDYALGNYTYQCDSFNDPSWTAVCDPNTWNHDQSYQYLGVTFEPETGPYYFIGYTDYKNIGVDRTTYATPVGQGRAWNTGKAGYWMEIGKNFEIMEDLELNVAGYYSSQVRQEQPPTKQSSIVLNSNDPTSRFAMSVSLTKYFHLMN